ncbi:importin 11, variant [Blastomyces dermatitidis ER-3]|uniref:Importin 11 n=3 Tax=Blastomyces TaxID=229219 RepID=A0A179UPU9_BLAGS|nr:importin 11 [Blastomyces gilchristii SLH14081]XP_031578617.1 importin 11, variant [Blastomyces gilchristii SLH14081]XP_045279704.1 importin 11 [Blastomyces dermatitidis ER-3]XP_045279705.1 importin 11, variant [Blastomyces dermatitidis ER-3]EGE79031.1 importin 11 [Blastomyces dermatitidis ATCC 18188]OAS99976.1 importin 11 [Blastomyces dermatitidis ER-3]OAS99977.1 importin 11, variant [Blastomyces dermatitidis ER-3]OAT09051.1 importin 11 [Blastomyces gilchristii SLH14081]OAT09052.1 import
MASMVELPGEANPLTRQNIFNALVSAAGSTQQQVITGGQQLQNWEKQANYFSLLQDIFVDYSLPNEVRYLSIIQLKNGIDKYWRKTAPNAIKPEEKVRIRSRALEAGAVEPDAKLALHNALMIAKIVRLEFPLEWPDAITSVITLLRASFQLGSNPLQLPRTLLILLHIIKELATGRLQRIKRNLFTVAPEIFHILANIYVEKVNKWGTFLEASSGDDEGGALEALDESLITLKTMRRLIVAGFEHPNRDNDVQQFWALSLTHLGNFYSLLERKSSELAPNVSRLLERHIVQLSKLHLEMAKNHPAAFALFPGCVDLARSYWGLVVELAKLYDPNDMSRVAIGTDGDADDDETPFLEKIALKGLLILRTCIKMAFYPAHTFKYQHAQDKEEKSQSIELIKSQLLTHEFVVQVMELLITRFFVFRASDLRQWEEDPEEWEKREEEITDAYDFSIRSCSEKVFLDLLIHFKELLVPKLLHVFYSYANPQNQEVLLKDSLYSAIGLGAAILEKQLDFNAFLSSTLIPEVQIQHPGYNLLRRRIAILLGQWVPVKADELDMPSIYQVFQHLLNKSDPTNDQVVRVTAGRQLKNVLEPFEFSIERFLPYATPTLQSLMDLVSEVSLSETKMALLGTVRIAIVKMEDHIAPYADQIVSLLPQLWEQSSEENLMKQAILTLLSSLIHSMKQDSVRYHQIIIPLIQKSVDPGSEALVYLLEEALDLWSAVLMQAPSPASPELLQLLPYLFPVFDIGTESLRQALEVTESYILLSPQEMLNDNIRFRLLVALEALLSSTTRQRIGVVPHLVELLIRAVELVDPGNEQAYSVVAKSLLDSSFLLTLLSGLRETYEAHLTTGPNKKSPGVDGVVETDYFSVLARIALGSPKIFISSAVSSMSHSSEEETVNWILTEWFSHFDNVGDINRKKLHALALTHLLSINGHSISPPAYLLKHLQSYLVVWTDLIRELSEGTDYDPNDPRGGDYLIVWNTDSADQTNGKYQSNESPETTRRRAWSNADPVHKINFRHFVTENLRGVVGACGGMDKFRDEWLINVDREVVNGFGELGLL